MSLEIVIGPMFSGKSSYALSYIRKYRAIQKNVVAVKPDIDKRYSNDNVIVTHNKDNVCCVMWDIEYPLAPTRNMMQADYIVIEEAQFFKGLYSTVEYLLKAHNKDILIVGLDGDSNQKPFGEIFDCIPLATRVEKLTALCSICKNGNSIAPYTKKIQSDSQTQIDVGGNEKYIPVCLKHLYIQ